MASAHTNQRRRHAAGVGQVCAFFGFKSADRNELRYAHIVLVGHGWQVEERQTGLAMSARRPQRVVPNAAWPLLQRRGARARSPEGAYITQNHTAHLARIYVKSAG